MRIRDLKRAGFSVWPLRSGSSFGSGDTFAVGAEGILKGVKRIGNRLALTIEWEAHDVIAALEWDAPPTLEELETLLRAQTGKRIKAIGDMEV